MLQNIIRVTLIPLTKTLKFPKLRAEFKASAIEKPSTHANINRIKFYWPVSREWQENATRLTKNQFSINTWEFFKLRIFLKTENAIDPFRHQENKICPQKYYWTFILQKFDESIKSVRVTLLFQTTTNIHISFEHTCKRKVLNSFGCML